MVVAVFSDESLISRNLDWNLRQEINVSRGVSLSIPADKWPAITERWLYLS